MKENSTFLTRRSLFCLDTKKMTVMRRAYLPLVALVAFLSGALADDNYNYYNYNQNQAYNQNQYNNEQYNQNQYNANQNGNNNDDYQAVADDGMEAYGNNYYQNDYQEGDDYIQYWTDYALLPKRCIV